MWKNQETESAKHPKRTKPFTLDDLITSHGLRFREWRCAVDALSLRSFRWEGAQTGEDHGRPFFNSRQNVA